MIFQIEYKEFINQMQTWNIVNSNLIKIIMEETENIVAFFLPLEHVTYATVVRKSELSTADLLNFQGISIRGRRFNEVERLRIERFETIKRTEKKKPLKTEIAKPFFYESSFQKDTKKRKEELKKQNANNTPPG